MYKRLDLYINNKFSVQYADFLQCRPCLRVYFEIGQVMSVCRVS